MNKVAVMAKIADLRLSNTPAQTIVSRPGYELWLPPTPAAVAEQLCRNVYWYGRSGAFPWSWVNGNDKVSGESLARGWINGANAYTFNDAARWIGCNVLGLTPQHFAAAGFEAGQTFITATGSSVIDRNWSGNVRTLTQDFAQFKAHFFVNHSYCQYDSNYLDVSTNTMNFHDKTDLFWCSLERVYNTQFGRAFRTVVMKPGGPTILGPAPYVVISTTCLRAFCKLFPAVNPQGSQVVTQAFIRTIPGTIGAQWETILLVSRAHLSAEFLATVNL